MTLEGHMARLEREQAQAEAKAKGAKPDDAGDKSAKPKRTRKGKDAHSAAPEPDDEPDRGRTLE